jgi:hypothetical protein
VPQAKPEAGEDACSLVLPELLEGKGRRGFMKILHQPDVIGGSSRDGAVAMNFEVGEAKLVLLCPAWKKWGTVKA